MTDMESNKLLKCQTSGRWTILSVIFCTPAFACSIYMYIAACSIYVIVSDSPDRNLARSGILQGHIGILISHLIFQEVVFLPSL